MEDPLVIIKPFLSLLAVGVLILCGWKILNWAWLTPKKLEKCLRQQGFNGNSYRLLFGEIKEMFTMTRQARSRPMSLTDDIAPYVIPYYHQTVTNYGKNSIRWFGPSPRVTIMDPELIREIFNKFNEFQKPRINPLITLLFSGILTLEGERWAKHRKIITPSFHLDKLKNMLPAFYECCTEMIEKWEEAVSVNGSSEVDVWPCLVNLTRDVISRAAFGSSYEEGRRIFLLLDEQTNLLTETVQSLYVPGWRFLPTKTNKKLKLMDKEIKDSLRELVKNREKAVKAGEVKNDDLLGILVESNFKEIEEHGDRKNMGMSIQDVVDECKLFYIAGQETTSVLLVWTMVLLARNPDWQTKAREEVFQVFSDGKPDPDGLSHLKVMTMILNEVLRLYPPVVMLGRSMAKDMKLGKLLLPAGAVISIPVLLIHHDQEIWGDDAHEFTFCSFMGFLILLLLLTFTTLPLSSSDPNDEACLTQLSQNLKDPLNNLQNWTKSTFANPCSGFTSYLPGATCNNGRIYKLSLTNLSLQGSISPFLSNCTNLQSLDLSSNSISGPIPQDLQYLVNLAVLNLSSNRLEGEIPQQLALCAYLNVIDLHDNLLTGQIPQELGLLARLSAFDVSNNKLSGPIPASLGNRSGNLPRFNATSFGGNKDLYGYPLPPMKSKGLSVLAIVGIGLGSGLASLVISFTGVCIWLKITEEKMAAAEEGKIGQFMPDY